MNSSVGHIIAGSYYSLYPLAKEVSLCVVPERLQTEVTVANAMLEEDRYGKGASSR